MSIEIAGAFDGLPLFDKAAGADKREAGIAYAMSKGDRYTTVQWARAAAKELAEAREAALVEYCRHEMSCPLAQWSQGRPTKEGGYETMYAGKWYQGDDKPACTCGLDAALATPSTVQVRGETVDLADFDPPASETAQRPPADFATRTKPTVLQRGRCTECGWDGMGGCIEDAGGRIWHFRANIERGKIAPIRCYGKVEELPTGGVKEEERK